MALIFRLRRQEGSLVLVLFWTAEVYSPPFEDVLTDGGQPTAPAEAATQVAQQTSTSGRNVYTQILRVREVHLLSIWCLIYVGVEVSLGGELSR